MNKSDLLVDLNSSESTLKVLEKGYLFHMPLDEEIYMALVKKLSLEANQAGLVLESEDSLPGGSVESSLLKMEEVNKVVFSTILDLFHKENYVVSSMLSIQKFVNPSKIAQMQQYLNQGYSFAQDPVSGNFKILDKTNSLVATYKYQSIKEILQDMGVDTSHSLFYLFYAAIFPRQDLELFRALTTFNLHFHFN